MRSFVTGAGGFVGANLVRRLLAEGDDVVAAIRPAGTRWRLDDLAGQVEVADLDLTDPGSVLATVQRARPDRVFHLAAHGAYSWQDDAQRILAVNVLGTAAVLAGARAAGSEVVVHAGSSSEYGFRDAPPTEDDRVEPNSVYAVGKAAATHLTALEGQAGGPRATTLRLYSVYGQWEEPNRLIPRLLTEALQGRLPPLADAGTARDFVHVDDVCDAFLAAAGAPDPSPVYNVATGRQTTLGEIVEVVRGLVPGLPEPEWGGYPARTWDTSSWVGDPARAAAELGWQARTDLAAGLRRTIRWLADEAPPARYDRPPAPR